MVNKNLITLLSQRNIKFLLANPSLFAVALTSLGNTEAIKKKWIQIRLKKASQLYDKFKNTLTDESKLFQVLEEITQSISNKDIYTHLAYHLCLYVLVRTTKPESIIETGVAGGDSSALILQALHDNKKGKLYSIDLPYAHFINSKGEEKKWDIPPENIGSVVPDFLRDRWELILGDSNEELPKLLTNLGQIDHFHHDDEEIRMKWQFDLVLPYINKGGILSSDDVNLNDSFQSFCKPHNFPYVELWRNSKQSWGVTKIK